MITAHPLRSFFSALAPNHWRDLYRNFRNHRWERNDDGDILISHATIRGRYEIWAPDGLGVVETTNLITTEGANYLLAVGVGGSTQYGAFYLAPFSGNVSVVDTWTAATFASAATELTTQYSEGSRVVFNESVPASKSTNNTSNPAVFTSAVDNVSIWGIGLLSTATKAATSGVLLSASKYPAVRTLTTTGDTLGAKHTITLANA